MFLPRSRGFTIQPSPSPGFETAFVRQRDNLPLAERPPISCPRDAHVDHRPTGWLHRSPLLHPGLFDRCRMAHLELWRSQSDKSFLGYDSSFYSLAIVSGDGELTVNGLPLTSYLARSRLIADTSNRLSRCTRSSRRARYGVPRRTHLLPPHKAPLYRC